MISGSFGHTKPSQWNIDRAHVAQEWQWFHDDLSVLIPLNEGGGRPIFYINGKPIVSELTGSVSWSLDSFGHYITRGEPIGTFWVGESMGVPLDADELFNWGSEGPLSITVYSAAGGVQQTVFAISDDVFSGQQFIELERENFPASDGSPRFELYGNTSRLISGSENWLDNAPVVCGLSYKGDNQKLFVNGQLAREENFSTVNSTGRGFNVSFLNRVSGTGTTPPTASMSSDGFTGRVYWAAIHKKQLTETQHKQLAADPYGPFRHKQDTIHPTVYPRQRDYSQVPEYGYNVTKPYQWNVDPTQLALEWQNEVLFAAWEGWGNMLRPIDRWGDIATVGGTFDSKNSVVQSPIGPALQMGGGNAAGFSFYNAPYSKEQMLNDWVTMESYIYLKPFSEWTETENNEQSVNGMNIISFGGDRPNSLGQGSLTMQIYNWQNGEDVMYVRSRRSHGTPTEASSANGSIKTGQWYHIVTIHPPFDFVNLNEAGEVYINGINATDSINDGNNLLAEGIATGDWGIGARTFSGQGLPGAIAYARVWKGALEQSKIRALATDPWAPLRHKQDTIHPTVYPRQRDFTQGLVRKIPPRPPEWNIDSNYTDPDAPKPIFAWEAYARGVDQPGGGGVDSYGFIDWVSGQWAGYARQGVQDTSFKTAEFGTYWDTPTDATFGNQVAWRDSSNPQDATPSVNFINGEAFRSYDIAWETLVYVPSDGAGSSIFEVGNFAQGQDGSFQVKLDPSDQTARLSRRTSGLDQNFNSPAGILPLDRWVHIVIQRTRDKGILYIDGKIVHTQNFGASYTVHEVEGTLEIGDALDVSHFRGGIAHIRVYNEVLDQDKITKLAEDPFWPIRHKQDTIHPTVYPMQRNYSQNRIIYKQDKPKPWNI